MRPPFGKQRGVSLSALFLFAWPVAGLGLIAVFLGWSYPQPAAGPSTRSSAHPRYVSVGPARSRDHKEGVGYLLDTETGTVVPCQIPGMLPASPIGCSPWRDRGDRYHLVGQSLDGPGSAHGLVRSSFPGGRVLDVVALDTAPVGRPCWSPERRERILFACGDSRIYTYDFPAPEDARRSSPGRPRAVRWLAAPVPGGAIRVVEPCWPAVPGLGGRVLAVLFALDAGVARDWNGGLWWLELNVDGDAIVAAERAIVPDGDAAGRADVAERLPAVGTARDGTPMLAYLAQSDGQHDFDLWLTPIMPAAAGAGPRILAAQGRKLSRGCAQVGPAFSPDGRWLYAWRLAEGNYIVERFAVGEGREPPPTAETPDQQCAPVGGTCRCAVAEVP
jgi:hypothetical protein